MWYRRFFLLCCMLCSGAPVLDVHGATWYVDAASGNVQHSGSSWQDAFASIQTAIERAKDGDEIVVGDGTYGPISSAEKLLTIHSLHGAESTVIDGGGRSRCATLSVTSTFATRTNTVLVGFTLRNGSVSKYGGGAYGGFLRSCVIRDNVVSNCGGGAYYAYLEDCTLKDNSCTGSSSANGGGTYDCYCVRCSFSGNKAQQGGGSYGSTLFSCILRENEATAGGGGSCSGKSYNCLMVGNRAPKGAGVFSENPRNCIIWDNCKTGTSELANYDTAGLSYCCSDPLYAGTGNVCADPLFVDAAAGNYRLKAESPCVDSGLNLRRLLFMDDVSRDMDGGPRIRGMRIDMGPYERESDTRDIDDSFVWYVNAETGSDENSGLQEELPFKTIGKAVDMSGGFGLIIVADGIYPPFSIWGQGVRIESAGGAEKAIVDGGGRQRCVSDLFLGFPDTNDVVRGFTIRNGYSSGTSSYGGGANGGTFERCIFTGNRSEGSAGAVHGVALINCLVVGNQADKDGGGGYQTYAFNCTFANNRAKNGGGIAYPYLLHNCIVYGNVGGDIYQTYPEPEWRYQNVCTGTGIPGTSVLVADPLFAAPADGDWRLQAVSPCVDAGVNDNVRGEPLDLAGARRIRNQTVDLGAYEYAPPGLLPELTEASVLQRYPWNGLVDIRLKVEDISPEAGVEVTFSATDADTGEPIAVQTVEGPAAGGVASGWNRFVWNADADAPDVVCRNLKTTVELRVSEHPQIPEDALYMVIGLSGGEADGACSVEYLTAVPDGGWTDEHRTDKLVLRRVKAGDFTMGCADDEVGEVRRLPDGSPVHESAVHRVTLSKDYFIGVFEVTQAQWKRVMGTEPSWFSNARDRETRPVENVSFADIRGTASAQGLATAGFMSALAAKTGFGFDLPTEAQWECACRAGTATALNGGTDLTDAAVDAQVARLARYRGNSGYAGRIPREWANERGTARVGSYEPNAWGLYDMHGNVQEWCLDGFRPISEPAAARDPLTVGGPEFVIRGGSWRDFACQLRSGCRYERNAAGWKSVTTGFRVAFSPDESLLVAPTAVRKYELPSCRLDTRQAVRTADDVERFVTAADWQGEVPSEGTCVRITHTEPGGRPEDVHAREGGDVLALEWKPASELVSGVHVFRHEITDRMTGKVLDVQEARFKVIRPDADGSYAAAAQDERLRSLSLSRDAIAGWRDLEDLLIGVRDALATYGNPDAIPPTENAIVLSLGVFPVSTSLAEELAAAAVPTTECGESVYHVRVMTGEDGLCALVATVDGTEVHAGFRPFFDERKWTDAICGSPPPWLSGSALDRWYRLRRPSRIEWFVTLVPETAYTAFLLSRSRIGKSVSEEGLTGVTVGEGGLCKLSVAVRSGASADVFGREGASAAWEYRGRAFLVLGPHVIGGLSETAAADWKVCLRTADSDGDGLRDEIESFVFGSDPTAADTSGDGLTDGDKTCRFDLDARLSDSDGDGWDDDEEIAMKGNPLSADAGAGRAIRYAYDADGRLIKTRLGAGHARIEDEVSPAGNARCIRERSAK